MSLNGIFYLTQYIPNIIISVGNQNKIINEIPCILSLH